MPETRQVPVQVKFTQKEHRRLLVWCATHRTKIAKHVRSLLANIIWPVPKDGRDCL